MSECESKASDVISTEVFDNQSVLTVEKLRETAECSLEQATSSMADVLTKSKNSADQLNAVYFICGEQTDSNGNSITKILLVPENQVEIAKEKFQIVHSCHVYSLSLKQIKDPSALYDNESVPRSKNVGTPKNTSPCENTVKAPEKRPDSFETVNSDEPGPSKKCELPPKSKSRAEIFFKNAKSNKLDKEKLVEKDKCIAEKKSSESKVKTPEKLENESAPNKSCVDLFTTGDSSPEKSPKSNVTKVESAKSIVTKRDKPKSTKRKRAVEDGEICEGLKDSENAQLPKNQETSEIETTAPKAKRTSGHNSQGVYVHTVPATFMDDDGFLVTKKVTETVKAEPAPDKPPEHLKPVQRGKVATKKAPVPKHQASLTSFFKKK